MKFNLQHFAQVPGARTVSGGIVEEEKKKRNKKILPKLPDIPVVTPPVLSSRDAAAAGTAVNPNTGETLGTFEEGKAQFEQLRADTAAELAGRTTKAQELEQALVQQETPVQEEVKGPSTEDQLRTQSDTQTKALLAELRQRIADDVASQQGIISQAPQQFDPLRAQSEVSKAQQLRSALERSSVLGDRGGIGRSEALATQTAGENRLTDINLAQQNVIDNAQAEIASLNREGNFQEAAIKANQLAQLTDSLIAQQQRQEDIARQDTLIEEERGLQDTEQKKQDFVDTITRFAQDYTAEIDRNLNDGDTTNDWQIPLLETARQDKIATEGLDPNTGLPLPVDNTAAIEDSAYRKISAGIPLNAQEAAQLGVREGYTKPRTSSGGTSGLSASGVVSLAKWKVDNGLALTADEASAVGLAEGFVDPNFEGTPEATAEGLNPTVSASLNQYIQEKGGDTKQAVIEFLINQDGNYSVADGYAILDAYGLSAEDLQRVVNVNPSIGQ